MQEQTTFTAKHSPEAREPKIAPVDFIGAQLKAEMKKIFPKVSDVYTKEFPAGHITRDDDFVEHPGTEHRYTVLGAKSLDLLLKIEQQWDDGLQLPPHKDYGVKSVFIPDPHAYVEKFRLENPAEYEQIRKALSSADHAR